MASKGSRNSSNRMGMGTSPIRIINKSGQANIKYVGVSGWPHRFMGDFFTTMIELQWVWNISLFSVGILVTWILFAIFYWLVAQLHGDFRTFTENNNGTHQLCITESKSFASMLLFSIETQSTIGYGSRLVTTACPAAYVGVFLQSIIGAALQAALAGLVVAKVKRAKKRSNTVVFSTTACIVEEDDQMKLVLRVGDMRKSFIIQVHVMGYLFQKMATENGKTFPVKFQTLDFTGEDNNRQIFLAWPTQLVHVINENSPLWDISQESLLQNNFELVVILDGTVTTTSMPFQAKKSYLPWDILWGHRFETMGQKINNRGKNVVNFANFHKTHLVSTPTCSAKDLKVLQDNDERIPLNMPRPKARLLPLFGDNENENRNSKSHVNPSYVASCSDFWKRH